MQHFDACNSNPKKEKEKKNIQLTTFRNTCNITKPFEVVQGIFMDIKYDYLTVVCHDFNR